MKLTEREKWLMQQAWNASKDYNNESNTIADWMEPGLNNIDTEMLLAHDAPASESIVKQVDPDNLPYFEVAILDKKGELYCAGLFIENQRVVGFLNSKHEITRYIEIKDIIKWLEDSK